MSSIRLFQFVRALAFIGLIVNCAPLWAECTLPGTASATPLPEKLGIELYVQGELEIAPPSWIISRGFYISPEQRIINECSKILTAKTISDSLPERLNRFAYLPEEARTRAFIAVSSVDQKMAMQKTGPYWHAYVTAFPDLRFVGATVRLAHGLVTRDESIRSPADLINKRVGLVMRPSSLRALQEILLIKAWDIYDQIIVKEYLPSEFPGALERGEVDVVFMPIGRMADDRLLPVGVDFNDLDLHWISISQEDVHAATDNTPVLTERAVFSPKTGATNGELEVGLITFDAAWFTFASTPDDIVYEFIHAVQQVCPPQAPACEGRSPASMARWPGIEENLIHPGALKFYQDVGINHD